MGLSAGEPLMRIAFIIFLLWVLVVPAMSQTELPAGWRPIHNQKGALVRIDFDGDGRLDQAVLATDGHKIKAFAIIALQRGRRVTELMECGDIGGSCVLRILPPGRYVTVCGKQLVECNGSPEDPEEIVSKAPLLSMTINENIMVVLILRGSDVQRIWLTD
jgi:hypothetical protein